MRTVTWILLAGALLSVLSSCLLDPKPFDEADWRTTVAAMRVEDLYAEHQQDGVFFNPWLPHTRGVAGLIRWQLSTKQAYTREETDYLPGLMPDLLHRIEQLPADTDFLVWIGHGTFLIQVDSVYLLTDPILSQRALLPKRRTQPVLSLHELASLEVPLQVIISHNHYDHLDVTTIEHLPEKASVHVPLGLKGYVQRYHAGEVIEYDWWQSRQFSGWRLTCLPAQHWSRRIGQGRDRTLWASFMIEIGNQVIYFGGDSGYFIGYREFSRLYPDIDYALLPVTAYQPRWFMHYPHLNPEEAIDAYHDLGAKYFVPTQWGTFRLGDDPPGLAALELRRIISERGLRNDRYLMPELGQIVVLE